MLASNLWIMLLLVVWWRPSRPTQFWELMTNDGQGFQVTGRFRPKNTFVLDFSQILDLEPLLKKKEVMNIWIKRFTV